jgi:hypothetical protein
LSKLRCRCGHVIVDQAANLPFAGVVLADRDEGLLDAFTEESTKYFSATADGRRDQWMAGWYGAAASGLETIDHSSVVFDIFLSVVGRHSRRLYHCEACGRLHLQSAPESDRFRAFAPETD